MPAIQEKYWELEGIQKQATRIAKGQKMYLIMKASREHHAYLFDVEKRNQSLHLPFENLFGGKLFNRLAKVALRFSRGIQIGWSKGTFFQLCSMQVA